MLFFKPFRKGGRIKDRYRLQGSRREQGWGKSERQGTQGDRRTREHKGKQRGARVRGHGAGISSWLSQLSTCLGSSR